jgi:phosphohistidine phosphatase SixA
MQKLHPRLVLVGLVAFFLATVSEQANFAADDSDDGPKIVMIIRHAEKPDNVDGDKDPNLSEQGYQRANALAKVIPDHFPTPDFLIATKASKSSDRPGETITPLSKALHEEIEFPFKDDEYDQLAQTLLNDQKYDGKVVLICWHHEKIPKLAKALGVKDAPHDWDDDVFDRVWEITYDHQVATMKNLPQHALPGDSEE